jgi:hypothetical protein
MPITSRHVWHVQIHGPASASQRMSLIRSFLDGGFTVVQLPEGPSWLYSLHHKHAAAMTLHMLASNSGATAFTVVQEFPGV